MKKILPIILFLCTTQAGGQAFITTWNTANIGVSVANQVTIPTTGTGYSYSIYWEAVGNASVNGTIAGPITGNYTITFPSPGKYRVSITGDFPRIFFNEQPGKVTCNRNAVFTRTWKGDGIVSGNRACNGSVNTDRKSVV